MTAGIEQRDMNCIQIRNRLWRERSSAVYSLAPPQRISPILKLPQQNPWELSTSSVAVSNQLTLPASHQYSTNPGPLVTRFHKGTSGGARSDVLDGSVDDSECPAHIRRLGHLPRRRRRSTAGAVAPRPGARSRRRATPGCPGLSLTSSVDDLDRSPNTLNSARYSGAPAPVQLRTPC
jgi:hypothetical protein